MLEKSFKSPINDTEAAYDLTLPYDVTWNAANKRILVIMQTVDSRDLKAGGMLASKDTKRVFINALKFTRGIVRTYKESAVDASYAVINFNAYRHLSLKGTARKNAVIEFTTRARKLIKKLKPTHILVSGDEAMHALFPSIDNHMLKRGWVHTQEVNGEQVKVTSTLDLARLLEKDGQYANLLGFWCRHFANLHLGKDPHNLSHVKAEPRYVDTIEKFDTLMDTLEKADVIAVDTETRNLSVLSNAVYTIQFATNLRPDVGYVLAIRHPMTPWSKEEIAYIKGRLRKFFAKPSSKKKELVTFNGMFDLRVIRMELKLPIILHDVWEITSGESLLDENIVELNNFGAKVGGLAAVYCSYGNEFYLTAAFSKADRATTGNVHPTDKNFLLYGATDVVSLLHIREQQLLKADHQFIESKKYGAYFERHMLHQMSDTAHQLSHMKESGSLVDKKYLRFLTSPDSPLRKEMAEIEEGMREYEEVQQANNEIIGNTGLKAKGLRFGSQAVRKAWALSLTKPAHLRKLFFDVMKLEPLSTTKAGTPSVDKAMVDVYKDKNAIVSDYGDYTKLTKLVGTYAKGWLKKLLLNSDSLIDGHLRPDYSSFDVTTGRLASKNPSLQTIPSRGALAKIIKRMFIAPEGTLLIRYDYSAHEVRVWSIVAKDMVLAAVFKVGQQLRQMFIADPTAENKAAIKLKGDIHILNVKRLLNKIVDKDHPLRDSIKAIIFGLLYGKSASTLGQDTKTGDRLELKAKIKKAREERDAIVKNGGPRATEIDKEMEAVRAEIKTAESMKQRKTLKTKLGGLLDEKNNLPLTNKRRIVELTNIVNENDRKLRDLMAEDRTDYAQGLIDKVFKEFKDGGRWTNRMKELAEQKYMVYSPIGRVRHLYAAMTGDQRIVSQQVRRGSNAPIQGFASEIGVKAGRLVATTYYKELPRFCEMLGIEYDPWKLRIPYNRMVHDASYYSVAYAMVIPYIHILQYASTYGITAAYKEEFNVDFVVEPEIEVEVGVRDDQTHKWDWSLPNLVEGITKSVDQAIEFGLMKRDREEVLKEIFEPWKNKEMRNYLQSKYPLLNVPDLNKQIIDAIRPIYRPTNVKHEVPH